jgi:4-amino-4-deoxy-L-arabinose transferase-like glycosyltransferase
MSTQILPSQSSIKDQTWLNKHLFYKVTPAILILIGVMLLSAILHFYNIGSIEDANTYYTAAVKSMLQSWRNFFFVAAEPGGSVSIDKPPLGLWIETAFAAVLGVSGFAVSLPNILAGIFSIPLMYHLVKIHTNTLAGLVAALVMAATPVFLATNRNNTMDGMLVFTLLLAAWAFIKATERGSLRWLLIGGIIVGLGFNIKMMQAFLPLPAFYSLYFFGSRISWGRKLVHLTLTTVILLAVSFAWVIAVDLTPADQRPYIGSSENNTVMGLIFGHNGISRLEGKDKASGNDSQDGKKNPVATALQGNSTQLENQRTVPQAAINVCSNAVLGDTCSFDLTNGTEINGTCNNPPSTTGLVCSPQNRIAQQSPQTGQNAGPNVGPTNGTTFSSETGEPGFLRFFVTPLSKQMSWLLPFALVSLFLALFSTRVRLPLQSRVHQTLVLWGGWLLTCLVFFSMISGIFHAYYTLMLVPPLAAVVGLGFSLFYRWGKNHLWAIIGLLISLIITIGYQLLNAWVYGESGIIFLVSVGLLGLGLLSLVIYRRIAYGFLLAAMLVIPLFWTVKTVTTDDNQNLPTAYVGYLEDQRMRPAGQQSEATNDATLVTFLENNTQDMTYLVAVPSANQKGSELVLETGRPVLYMGGFNGGDDVIDADGLSNLVDANELRYIFYSNEGESKADIENWLKSSCSVVPQFSENGQNKGQKSTMGPKGESLTLFDCQ